MDRGCEHLLEPGFGDVAAGKAESAAGEEVPAHFRVGLQQLALLSRALQECRHRAGRHQDHGRHQKGPEDRQGHAQGRPEQAAFPLRRHARRAPCGSDRVPPDERDDGHARIPGGYVAGLGMVGRVLGVYPLRPGLQGYGPVLSPLRLQYLRCLLGRPLRGRKAGLRGRARAASSTPRRAS